MEKIRKQVQVSDIPEFDQRIKPLQEEILAGVSSFREVQQMYAREKQDKEPKRMPFARYKDTCKYIMILWAASVSLKIPEQNYSVSYFWGFIINSSD